LTDTRRGSIFGAGAYLIWGLFPLYFHLLAPSGAVEVVAHRVFWSALLCLGVVAGSRRREWVRPLLAAPARLARIGLAASLIAVNWGVYVYAVTSGHVVEAALGYFINPLVTVLLGVLLLRERLRRPQWAAVGLGAAAVVVLSVDYGRLPWVSLALAGSFAGYGLSKKQIGGSLGALASLTAETVLLAPIALAGLVWLELTDRGTVATDVPWHAALLASTGVATAAPLLLFAAAARRVPLVTIGLLQFITPVLQLLCGVLVLGERVPASRWVGFAMVWSALVVLSLDSWRISHIDRSVDGN
jgi:chloramphenicol-sensitive protein RarD